MYFYFSLFPQLCRRKEETQKKNNGAVLSSVPSLFVTVAEMTRPHCTYNILPTGIIPIPKGD